MVILLLVLFFLDVNHQAKKSRRPIVVADTYYSDIWIARRQQIEQQDGKRKPPLRKPVVTGRIKKPTGTPSGVTPSSEISSLLECCER